MVMMSVGRRFVLVVKDRVRGVRVFIWVDVGERRGEERIPGVVPERVVVQLDMALLLR